MRASRRAWQNCGKRSKTRFLAGMVLLLHSGSSPGADMSEDTRKRTGHEPTLPLIIGALISLTVISLVIGAYFEPTFRIQLMSMMELIASIGVIGGALITYNGAPTQTRLERANTQGQ